MKIELDTHADNRYRIDGYEKGRVSINKEIYTASVILTPDKLDPEWPPQSFDDLAMQHMEQLLEFDPEIILLGTGAKLLFPASDMLADIQCRHIGIEVMDTGAACRCYNLLASEERKVVAGLIMIR